ALPGDRPARRDGSASGWNGCPRVGTRENLTRPAAGGKVFSFCHLNRRSACFIVSTMIEDLVDASIHSKIDDLTRRVLDGGEVTREEALWLFDLESTADIFDLMAGANRLREHFKGNKIHLCSIVNAKAGACSENCSFCAQSAFHQTSSPQYGFIDPEPVGEAAEEANRNGVTALGVVAAWRG